MSKIELDERTTETVRNHCWVNEPRDLITRPRESWRVGVIGVVRAFGEWRTGVMVHVGRTRATVAYVTPSNRQLVRFETTEDVRIGRLWTPGNDAGEW